MAHIYLHLAQPVIVSSQKCSKDSQKLISALRLGGGTFKVHLQCSLNAFLQGTPSE